MLHFARLLILAAPLVFTATAASASANHYGLTISTGSTYNVSFNNGVFTATGDNAVLNLNDLENALAAGDVEVTTGNGSGGDEKGDLHVDAGLSWTNTSGLTLDAYHSIFVAAAVAVNGAGPVALRTNDGGTGGVLPLTPIGRQAPPARTRPQSLKLHQPLDAVQSAGQTFCDHVVPHAPGAIGAIAGKEACSNLCSQLFVASRPFTARSHEPRIKSTARDTERPA